MKYTVEYSRTAIRDLDRLWEDVFSASRSFEIAETYVDDLMNKIEDRSDFPSSGSPLYFENSFTGYYFIVFKAYIAFYRLEKDVMYIDRILFGKSDYLRHLHIDVDPHDH